MPSPSLVFGNVEHPPYENRLIADANNFAWDHLGARKTYGVVQHTMVTGLWSCDTYFRSGSAAGLTDYGIGGATDGADDGLILMWNDPTGKGHPPGVSPNRWPWASGPADGSNGDAVLFIQTYGANAVNGYLVSIERSDGGNPDIPASNRYIDSFVTLAAYYADQDQIPYDEYPWNTRRGVAAYYWHSEIYGGKTCPAGAKASTSDIQEEVKKVLKAAQTSGAEEGFPDVSDLPKSSVPFDATAVWPNVNTSSGVGKVWADYATASGLWPAPAQPWNDDDGSGNTIYVFSNGLTIIRDKNGTIGIAVEVK